MAAMSTADPLLLLKELHFQAIQQEDRLRLGSDVRFWHGFSRAMRALVRRQAFLPALFPWTEPAAAKPGSAPAPPACPPSLGAKPGRGRTQTGPSLRFTTGWLPFSAHYETHIAEFAPVTAGAVEQAGRIAHRQLLPMSPGGSPTSGRYFSPAPATPGARGAALEEDWPVVSSAAPRSTARTQ